MIDFKHGPFVAIDVETIDNRGDGVCAIGVARVEDGTIVDEFYSLVKPPRRSRMYERVHGLTSDALEAAQDFPTVWLRAERLMLGASFIAAHHAAFEQWTLGLTCSRYRLAVPSLPFVCTRRLASKMLGLRKTSLPAVCKALQISVGEHHNALHDARACAAIIIRLRARDC